MPAGSAWAQLSLRRGWHEIRPSADEYLSSSQVLSGVFLVSPPTSHQQNSEAVSGSSKVSMISYSVFSVLKYIFVDFKLLRKKKTIFIILSVEMYLFNHY